MSNLTAILSHCTEVAVTGEYKPVRAGGVGSAGTPHLPAGVARQLRPREARLLVPRQGRHHRPAHQRHVSDKFNVFEKLFHYTELFQC